MHHAEMKNQRHGKLHTILLQGAHGRSRSKSMTCLMSIVARESRPPTLPVVPLVDPLPILADVPRIALESGRMALRVQLQHDIPVQSERKADANARSSSQEAMIRGTVDMGKQDTDDPKLHALEFARAPCGMVLTTAQRASRSLVPAPQAFIDSQWPEMYSVWPRTNRPTFLAPYCSSCDSVR